MRNSHENQPGTNHVGTLISSKPDHLPVATSSQKRTYRHHQQEDSCIQGSGRPFCCLEPACGRHFSSKFKMMRHMLIHSGERQFKCSFCERCFVRKDHLKNHLQVHNPNKIVHTCDHCRKQYSSPLAFRKHLALHAAEAGELVCKLCGKVFADREQVMYHLKVHSGSKALRGPSERKYKCSECDRSFFTNKDIRRHMVVHTGIRNFTCQHCSHRFGRKDHLVRHLKKSHGRGSSTALANIRKRPTRSRNACIVSPDSKKANHTLIPTSGAEGHESSSTLHPGPPQMTIQEAAYVPIKQEPCFSSADNFLGGGPSALPSEDGGNVLKVGDKVMDDMLASVTARREQHVEDATEEKKKKKVGIMWRNVVLTTYALINARSAFAMQPLSALLLEYDRDHALPRATTVTE